jgi:hypothetical protein
VSGLRKNDGVDRAVGAQAALRGGGLRVGI